MELYLLKFRRKLAQTEYTVDHTFAINYSLEPTTKTNQSGIAIEGVFSYTSEIDLAVQVF